MDNKEAQQIALPANLPDSLRDALFAALDDTSVAATLSNLSFAVQTQLEAKESIFFCSLKRASDIEAERIIGSPDEDESLIKTWEDDSIHGALADEVRARLSAISFSSFSWPFGRSTDELVQVPAPYTLIIPFSTELIVTRPHEGSFSGYIALLYDSFPELGDESVALIISFPLLLSEYLFAAQRRPAAESSAGPFAHDLKQYLLLNQQFIYRLKAALGESANDEARSIIRRMEAACARMKLAASSLMLADRDSAGKLEIRPFDCDINQLVRDVLRSFEPRFELEKVVCDTELADDLPPGLADPAIFPSVLNNLLDNAIKYTEKDCSIRVRTWLDDEKRVCIEISDRGIGIPEKDRKHIFEKRFRARNTRGLSGTGLGLYLVKKIIDAHGGSITLASNDGYATSFVVSLPSGDWVN